MKEGKSEREETEEMLWGEMDGGMEGRCNLDIASFEAWSAPNMGFNSGFQSRFRFSIQDSLGVGDRSIS